MDAVGKLAGLKGHADMQAKLELVAVEGNLLDAIWTEQPASPTGMRTKMIVSVHVIPCHGRVMPCPCHLWGLAAVFVHAERFAGKRWQVKVAELRSEMQTEGCELVVLTALDEVEDSSTSTGHQGLTGGL